MADHLKRKPNKRLSVFEKFSFEHAPLKEFKAKMNFKIHLQRLFERIFPAASKRLAKDEKKVLSLIELKSKKQKDQTNKEEENQKNNDK